MSRQLERLLQIDELLRSSQRSTALVLAEALEVSERTIRMDLAFLRDRYGAPLVFNRKQGYHYSNPVWRLPSIPLSQGELFALTLGAKMLSAYAGSTYHTELQSAIKQLVNRLPDPTQVDLQSIANDRVVFRPGASVKFDAHIWQQLEFACQLLRSVKMSYFTAGRISTSDRIVDPYVLHFSNANPYLTGFCHTRQAVRDFRIDRIQSLEVLTDEFIPDPAFSPHAYLNRAFFHEQGGSPQTITIWFDVPTAPYIRERHWHDSQVCEDHPDGSLTFRVETRGLEEVKRWVLFYGKGAIVREPPELVELVRQEIKAMNKNYEI